MKPIRSFSTFALLVLVVGMLSGCKSFVKKPVQKELPPGTPQYLISMKGEGWATGVDVRGEYKQNMRIDQVLEAHDLKRKFKNMDIQIIRRVPDTGQILKMPVVYKSKMKNVKPEQDYAIHPNDQIIVKQVVETALDRLIEQLAPGSAR